MNDFCKFIEKQNELKKQVNYFNIGKTILNNNIICFVLGDKNSKNKIILQAGIHAREYITSFLMLETIKNLSNFCFDACVYIIPLANPDGFCDYKNIKNKNIKNFFSKFNLNLIKCNAKGVDLNTNFDALWGTGKSNIKSKPSYQNFIGFAPNSEKEVKALENFTKFIKPSLTVSFHSKGEVFYWGFNKSKKYRKEYLIQEKKSIKIIKKTTGYKPIFTKNSSGGYKDWCIKNLKIPSFTIEVGGDNLKHPIKLNNLKSIFDKNKYLVLNLIKEVF